MAYSIDADLEKFEKRILELSSDGDWSEKHDLTKEDIDLRLKAKGIDASRLTVTGGEQLRRASCFRTLYHIFDELASMGSGAQGDRSEDYRKRFEEEFNLQLTVGLDSDEGTGAEFVSRSILLVR